MGRRIDEAVWNERRELLQRQASSGMSAAQFCRENGVNLWNFNAWKRRLNGDAAPDWRMNSAIQAEGVDCKPSSFVQVPMPMMARSNGDRSWIEVSSADGIVVRVPSNNLSALKLVLGALAEENADAQSVGDGSDFRSRPSHRYEKKFRRALWNRQMRIS